MDIDNLSPHKFQLNERVMSKSKANQDQSMKPGPYHHRAPRTFGADSSAPGEPSVSDALVLPLGALQLTDAVNWGADDEPVAFTLTGVGVKDDVVLLKCDVGGVTSFTACRGPLLVAGAYHQRVVTPTGKVYFACMKVDNRRVIAFSVLLTCIPRNSMVVFTG